MLLIEQVQTNLIDQNAENMQEMEAEATKLRGIQQVLDYLLDLRGSSFSQLQQIALKTCRRFND